MGELVRLISGIVRAFACRLRVSFDARPPSSRKSKAALLSPIAGGGLEAECGFSSLGCFCMVCG